jgi:hypothetical protein
MEQFLPYAIAGLLGGLLGYFLRDSTIRKWLHQELKDFGLKEFMRGKQEGIDETEVTAYEKGYKAGQSDWMGRIDKTPVTMHALPANYYIPLEQYSIPTLGGNLWIYKDIEENLCARMVQERFPVRESFAIDKQHRVHAGGQVTPAPEGFNAQGEFAAPSGGNSSAKPPRGPRTRVSAGNGGVMPPPANGARIEFEDPSFRH